MNIIQIAFDALGKSTVTLTKNIQQGDHLTNKLRVTFYEGHPTISTVRLHAQKPDGSVTPIITSFESALQDDIWEYRLESWFTEYAGILTISVSVQFAGEVEGYETADIILYDDYAALEAAAVTDDTKALVTLDDSKVFVYDTGTSTYEEQTGLSYEIPKEYQRSIKLSIEKSVISSGTSNLPPTSEPYILLLINNNATRISILENTTNDHEERLDAAEPIIASNTNRIVTLESDKADKTELAVETLRIDRILDGTTIVPKAYADEDGTNIKANYVRIGDDPNTPILDENNKLPNSYLQDDVPLLDENDKLDSAWLKDDVPLIDTKTPNGMVFYNASLDKIDTISGITINTSDLEITASRFKGSLTGTSFRSSSVGYYPPEIVLSTEKTPAFKFRMLDNDYPNYTTYSFLTLQRITGAAPDFSSTDVVSIRGDGLITTLGGISLGGDLNLTGDIIQQGSAYETHAEQVYTTNDTIILRDGAVGGLAVGAYAGLRAKLADGTNDSAFVFDGNGMARVGDISYDDGVPNYSNTQMLATRQDSPTSNGVPYYNASSYRFDTSSGLVSDLGDNANAGLLINKSAGAGNIANFQFGGANKLEITKDGFITQNGTRFIHNYGTSNLFVGKTSGNFTLTGSENAGFGNRTLESLTSGANNTAVGNLSLYTTSSGQSNSAVGYAALYTNSIGVGNSGLGHASLYNNATGSNNVAVGYNSGRYYGSGTDALTNTNNSLYLGAYARANANTETNQIVIGYNAIGQGSNSVVLGNTDITKTILRGNVGINQTSPTSQLHIVSSATDKVGLIVAGDASATANIFEFKKGTTNLLYLNTSGELVSTAPAYFTSIINPTSANNSRIYLNTMGTEIRRNIADANPSLIVNQANASSTGKILELQFAGTTKSFLDIYGYFKGAGVRNITSSSNGELGMYDNGMVMTRDVADADNTKAALKINNQQGNGDIVKFQYGGSDKARIDKDGKFVSLITTGTSPMTIASTTLVSNLNADLLDGNEASAFAAASHTHTVSNITDFPSSLPASDVYSWAKAATKPSYAYSELTGTPPAIALTEVQTITTLASFITTIYGPDPTSMQEGDVLIATTDHKTYIHNGGTAGTAADFSELATPTDSVTSVNGDTGVVVLDASDIGAVASNTAITGATKTKITYDAKGLVTAGADATLDDIADGSTRKLADYALGTHTQAVNKGGTNITTYAKGDILYSDAANSLAKLAIGTENQVLSVSAAGVPEWKTGGTSYAGTTETLLATRTATGTFSVTDLDTYDYIVLELDAPSTYGEVGVEMFQDTYTERTQLNIDKFSYEYTEPMGVATHTRKGIKLTSYHYNATSCHFSLVPTNAAKTSVELMLYGTAPSSWKIRIYGGTW